MIRRRVFRIVCVGAIWLGTRNTSAGDGSYSEVLASTPDGRYRAVYESRSGTLIPECGLFKAEPAPEGHGPRVVVPAHCEGRPHEMLPIEKWKWERLSPEITALRPFDRTTAGSLARVVMDDDTQVWRLEIRRSSAWTVARIVDGSTPGITGVLETPSGYLVRATFSESLDTWDEIWTFSIADVSGAGARRAQARRDALEATQRMREHRAKGTAVFAPPPSGTTKESWERRRRHGIATFVHKWEIVAAYGPLDAAELRDALWLLAWFDSPPRRYEALRWYTGLHERDPPGATTVLAELEKDPDARGLVAFLRSSRDYLRHLPDPTRQTITDETLRGLSDEDVRWVHRALWAMQAGYRFRDPVVAEYFALVPHYSPMPERRWQRLMSDPAWVKNPDTPLLRHDPGQPGNDSLEAILRAERARGLIPPAL